ncbi:hypothetical protein [Hydrogenophilus thiooxidans]|uniref:hypothetical protein n=1 Tax=Hydrogenophilus thiooxidans TaxID=2820326 RepID=UPI001C218EEA|nr:hypothetical protein [Hydrogenophilus thiooxidans]
MNRPIVARALLVGAIAFGVAACTTPFSEVPVATNFPTTTQEKLQSAHHWQVIAEGIAAQITQALQQEQGCRSAPLACPTLAFASPDRPSPFERALIAAITTELVRQGWKVRTELPAEITLRLEVQANRFRNRPADGRFTSAAVLGAGLWVLSDDKNIGVWEHVSPGASALIGLAAADLWRWQTSQFAQGPTPEVELMVHVSAVREGVYLARTSEVFYIADSDLALYTPPPAPLPAPTVLPVRGS